MSYLNTTHFIGVSGPVAFSGADRSGIIDILQFVGNESEIVGQFNPEPNDNVTSRLYLNHSIIHWPTGYVPPDMDSGGFSN